MPIQAVSNKKEGKILLIMYDMKHYLYSCIYLIVLNENSILPQIIVFTRNQSVYTVIKYKDCSMHMHICLQQSGACLAGQTRNPAGSLV